MIRVWHNLPAPRRAAAPPAKCNPPSSLPPGKLLATTGAGAADGHVCLWDWRAGALLARQALPGGAGLAAFTEDGLALVAAGKGAYKVRVHPGPSAALRDAQGPARCTAAAAAPRARPPAPCACWSIPRLGPEL